MLTTADKNKEYSKYNSKIRSIIRGMSGETGVLQPSMKRETPDQTANKLLANGIASTFMHLIFFNKVQKKLSYMTLLVDFLFILT